LARKPKTKKEDVDSYRHEDETRKNAVPVGLASYDTSKPKPNRRQGFNKTNLWYMRQCHLVFRNLYALSGELTWTHYRLLLKVEEEEVMQFYMNECIQSNWNKKKMIKLEIGLRI
jgi:hypothetical protein